jgi:hypothetical protein
VPRGRSARIGLLHQGFAELVNGEACDGCGFGIQAGRCESRECVDLEERDAVEVLEVPDDEVDAAKVSAAEGAMGSDSDIANALGEGFRKSGRALVLAPSSGIARSIGVEIVVGGDDLGGRKRHGLVEVEHSAGDLSPFGKVFYECDGVEEPDVLQGFGDFTERGVGFDTTNADGGPMRRRFHDNSLADFVAHAMGKRGTVTAGKGESWSEGKSLAGKELPGPAFVHGKGARQDSGADVGDIENLEKSLEGAVLTNGTVGDRKDNVEGAGAQCFCQGGDQLEADDAVAGVQERLRDPFGRRATYLGFGGGAPLNDRDGQGFHGAFLCSKKAMAVKNPASLGVVRKKPR